MKKSFKILIYLFIGILVISLAYLVFIILKTNNVWADVTDNNSESDISYYLPIVKDMDESQALYFDDIVLSDGSPRLNILLLGSGGPNHPGGSLTDSIQIFSLNPETQKVALISLPRDLYVQLDNYGGHKLNAALPVGLSRGVGGDLVKNVVSKILGIPVQKYVNINFNGFKDLINSLGGIDLFVSKHLVDYEPGNELNISAGQHHMDGETALKYSRSRKTTSDFDRSRRQQEVITAVKHKMTDWKLYIDLSRIHALLNIVQQNMRTDIGLNDFYTIIQKTENINFDNVNKVVIDNNPKDNLLYSTTAYGSYILLPKGGNFKKIRQHIQKYLP